MHVKVEHFENWKDGLIVLLHEDLTAGLYLLFFAAFSLTGVVILLRHRPHLTVERREE